MLRGPARADDFVRLLLASLPCYEWTDCAFGERAMPMPAICLPTDMGSLLKRMRVKDMSLGVRAADPDTIIPPLGAFDET